MATLVCCSGCERFVRSSDDECPFCGKARTARKLTLRRPRVARAAMVAMALAGGCTESMPLYGAPPPEDSGPPPDTGVSDAPPSMDAGPVMDAGDVDSSTEPMDAGMDMPLYGGAPPER